MLVEITARDLVPQLIDNYFRGLKGLCVSGLPSRDLEPFLLAGDTLMHTMVEAILTVEEKDQIRMFEQVQQRFMFILRDHDRPWIWELLGRFSEHLPEQMLH